MSLFSEGGTSYPDFLIVVLLSFLCLLSCFFNCHVFLHNWKKIFSVPVLLFRLVPVLDVIVALLVSIDSGINIGAVGEPKCWTKISADNSTLFLCQIDYDASVKTRLMGLIKWLAIVSPNWVIAVMAICRFLQIKFPFRSLKRKYVYLSFMLFGGYTIPLISWLCLADSSFHVSYIQNMMNLDLSPNPGYSILIIFLPSLLAQILSVATSLFTVRSLIRQTSVHTLAARSRDVGRRSSQKILLTNLVSVLNGVILCITSGISVKLHANKCVRIFTFTRTVIFPVVLSVINPVIFIILTPGLWTTVVFSRIVAIRR